MELIFCCGRKKGRPWSMAGPFIFLQTSSGSNLCCKIGFFLRKPLTQRVPYKAANRNILADRRDGLVEELLDRLIRIFHILLLKETDVGIKLIDLPLDNLLDNILRLAGFPCLGAVDFLLALDNIRGYFFAAHILGSGRRNVHSDILHESLEVFVTRNEVGLGGR